MLIEQLHTLSILVFHYWTLLHGPETRDKNDKSLTVNFRTLSTNPVPIFVLHKAILQLLQQYIGEEDNWMYFYKYILLTLLKRSCDQQRLKKKTSQLDRRVTAPVGYLCGLFPFDSWEQCKRLCFLPFVFLKVIWSLPMLKGDAILLHLKDAIWTL